MSNVRQPSFAGGELAPALYARTDVTKYATGLRTCRNFRVMRHGGVENRPGTTFLAAVKDSTKATRLFPFIFNASQTYVIEAGDLYFRFYQNGVRLSVSGVAAWSNAINYTVGALASRLGVNYYCILAHTNHQPPNATYWYPLTGSIYEIPTPYLSADVGSLAFAQSADVVTIVHPNYPPANLSRTGNTAWALTPITFAPALVGPTPITVSGGTASAALLYWAVTSISSMTGEESLPTINPGVINFLPTAANPTHLSWPAATGAGTYNVYRGTDGVTFGYIGTAAGTSFDDYGGTPITSLAPPSARNPFPGSGDYPSTVGYYQQRRLFAHTNNHPETVYASRTANFNNFTITSPSQSDDAITFTMVGRQVNQVQHVIDLGKLLVLTSGAIWSCEGDSGGTLLPTAINARQQSVHGSSAVPPIAIGTSLLYIQARGSIVRDLTQDPIQGYRGNDLTIYSAHLFDQFTITAWDYQEIPQSIVWVVRSDGTLLGLTYVPEQALWGWHRHDTQGSFLSIATVPEGNLDTVYVIVSRVVNGSTLQYVERFATRQLADIRDACFLDASLVYDGRNTNLAVGGNVGLVNGTLWNQLETIQLNANSAQFVIGDVGNAVFLTASDGSELRCTITSYVSATEVFVRPNRTVPLDLRNAGTPHWSKAIITVTGLSHLEGLQVGVSADGYVVASPNNSAYVPLTVTSGQVTLDRPYAVIRVGLSYLSDLETLDIDTPQGPSLKDKGINVQKVGLFVEASRGMFAGRQFPTGTNPLEKLTEYKARDAEGYDDPMTLQTQFVDIPIEGNWNSTGRIVVRQVDPLPLTILSVTPQGFIPGGG